MKNGFKKAAPRRGAVLVYSIIMMVALTAMSSLAIDWGHVQLVKTELATAADAAARAGASGLSISPTEAVARARAAAALNTADRTPVNLDATLDIDLGTWNTATRQFTKLTGGAQSAANAVRVTARRTAARGNHVKLVFATLIGYSKHDVASTSIAMYIAGINLNQSIQGTANPFLAGMPAGTVASLNNPHNNPDYAGTTTDPRQSPIAAPIPVGDGQVFNFDSIDGTVRHDPSLAYYSPDGQLSDIGHNTAGAEHGISDMNCPINALVGVFLSEEAPDKTLTPNNLDFSTDNSRNFNELRPQLKQLFFIGDGLNSNGQHQNFIAPQGATRLYLATWDFFEWNNNAGSRAVKIIRPERIVLVK